MRERPGWLIATKHEDCDQCNELVETALSFANWSGMVTAESRQGEHLANVERML